ncbi:MAG TPA: SLC13 family permease [Natrialbaceae archaeon]|nr:SLC13 family permease [Natrialbaceae archaeon]
MTATRRDRGFVLLAAVAFVAVVLAPIPDLSRAGQYALATTAFAGTLWLTGGLPLAVTALLVPVLLTATGVQPTMADALAGFADPVIFLLLAGFMLAEAFQAENIDRRIAYRILAAIGTSPHRLVLGVMIATAGLSMLVSNSATTAMMVPIAFGIVRQVEGPRNGAASGTSEGSNPPTPSEDPSNPPTPSENPSNFELSLLLGTAYAASIGGVGTVIGTPPNTIVVARLEEQLGVRVSFLDWMAIGIPIVLVALPLAWYLLTYRIYPIRVGDVSAARRNAQQFLREAGDLSRDGRWVLYVTAATAGLWVLGGLDFLFEGAVPATWYATLFGGTGSLFGVGPHQGLLYFVLVGLLAVPALVGSGAVEWDELVDIDWGTLLLLGGGISLADALAATDATAWLANVILDAFEGIPVVLLILALVALTVVFGEIASNTAMAAILVPLLVTAGPAYAAALATSGELAAVFLAVTVGVAGSFGFALPVATPPNAIAFGTGRVRREDMLRAGVVLDAVMVLVVTGMLLLLVRFVIEVVIG